jgi:uncharacterized membrane protein
MLASLAIIAALTALGWWLSQVTPLGRQLGTTLVVLLLGLLATNLSGWQPDGAAAAWVNGPLTSLAIAELLLAVRLRELWPMARRLLPPFAVSVASTVVAVLLGGLLLRQPLAAALPALAGLYAATFSGGSLNFVSVAKALQPPQPLVLLATAADHVVFALWFVASLALGRRQRGGRPGEPADGSMGNTEPREPVVGAMGDPIAEPAAGPAIGRWRQALPALAWGLAVLIASQLLTPLLQRLWPALPGILVLTTLALLVAQRPGSRVSGSYGLGLLLIQPFFTLIGLSSPVAGLLGEGRWVLTYAALVVVVQALGLLLVQRWRRWQLSDALVASQAAIGGPSTALALATSLGRPQLALPAVAIGLFGYLLGTYLGLAMAALLAGLTSR